MFIEEQELNDWCIESNDNNEDRKFKSISAYWLHNWYDKIKDITFKTIIYNNENEIPNILPFEKCMVRYENKSPKDSEYWNFVTTKKELINLFYTSLRCKTNPGKYYCVREWIELSDEYRCFWNNGLVAISSESSNKPPVEDILDYIVQIKDFIYFNRCVFDIAHIKETNKLIFIEYNSWQSNSGAHRFDWCEDMEIFYDPKFIVIRWDGGEIQINHDLMNRVEIQYDEFYMDSNLYEFIKPSNPCNWLITDKYVYISNDVWLGRFDFNLNPLNWISGIFRFDGIKLCDDGSIYCNDNFYYYDLTPKHNKSKIDQTYFNIDKLVFNHRYGIPLKNKKTNELLFIRMLDDCRLVIS